MVIVIGNEFKFRLSHNSNTIRKGKNPTIPSPAIAKILG